MDLLAEVSPFLRDSIVRSKSTALAIFLTKFRLEMSYIILFSLFHFSDKQTVSRAIYSRHSVLLQRFMLQNSGFNHVTAQEIIDNYAMNLAKNLLTTSSSQYCLAAGDEFRITVSTELIHIFFNAFVYMNIFSYWKVSK